MNALYSIYLHHHLQQLQQQQAGLARALLQSLVHSQLPRTADCVVAWQHLAPTGVISCTRTVSLVDAPSTSWETDGESSKHINEGRSFLLHRSHNTHVDRANKIWISELFSWTIDTRRCHRNHHDALHVIHTLINDFIPSKTGSADYAVS